MLRQARFIYRAGFGPLREFIDVEFSGSPHDALGHIVVDRRFDSAPTEVRPRHGPCGPLVRVLEDVAALDLSE